jgi:hypothetical protein
MYLPDFKYPSEWTESFEAYQKHKLDLIEFIQDKIDNYDRYKPLLDTQRRILMKDYLQADVMVKNITNVDPKI